MSDPKTSMIQFENHIVYGDVRVGQVFGVRTLLDSMTCQKYIASQQIQFSEQLGMSPEEFYEDYKVKEKKRLTLTKKKTQCI